MILRIVGPMQGVVKYYSSFYVALDLDSNDKSYDQIGNFQDIEYINSAQYALFTLMIYSISLSNNYIRNSIDYSFNFQIPSSIGVDLLSSYTYFIIDAPSFFNILFNVTTPTCLLYNLDEKIQNNYVQQCIVVGSHIQILLSQDLAEGYQYNLQINSVRGPSWQNCVNEKWVVNLISGDQHILVARTFFNTENIGLQSYVIDPSKTLLSYQDVNGGYEISTYQITPGVYSYPIAVVSVSNAFDKTFLLDIDSSSVFSSYPSDISVNL